MYLFSSLANKGVCVSCLVEFLENVPFGSIGWLTCFSPWISCWAYFTTDFLRSVFLKKILHDHGALKISNWPDSTPSHFMKPVFVFVYHSYSLLYCPCLICLWFRIALWINWRAFPFLPFSGKVLIRLRITAKFSNE